MRPVRTDADALPATSPWRPGPADDPHRWEAALDVLAALGVTAYRLPVSWPRLQPAGRGELSPHAVRRYRDLLGGLRARGIEPFVSLCHGDPPGELEARGGWTERETAVSFAGYARRTAAALGDLVSHWITVSEPWRPAFLGHGRGARAPGRRNPDDAVAAAYHLCLAHGLATLAVREAAPGAVVGAANRVTDIVAAGDSAPDRAAARRLDAVANRLFLDPIYHGRYSTEVLDCVDPTGLWALVRTGDLEVISTPTDFAGVALSRPSIARHDPGAPFEAGEQPAEAETGAEAGAGPTHAVLTRMAAEFTPLPLYMTESGTTRPGGTAPGPGERAARLGGDLAAAARALADGVDVRGCFIRSSTDDSAWTERYGERHGVLYVDYRTRERAPQLSTPWYHDPVLAMDSVPAA
ncbi:family 1 glycosylhydrolase [Nonomuraea sp. NPDC050783]|uniref:family 1 glycosylhydrolase n=1 Tax=Nonomuraea sp. NPDC050783 TaxID=3154634 RepID=UPI003467B1E5